VVPVKAGYSMGIYEIFYKSRNIPDCCGVYICGVYIRLPPKNMERFTNFRAVRQTSRRTSDERSSLLPSASDNSYFAINGIAENKLKTVQELNHLGD